MKSLCEKTIAFVLQYIDEQKLRAGDQLPTEAQISSLGGSKSGNGAARVVRAVLTSRGSVVKRSLDDLIDEVYGLKEARAGPKGTLCRGD